MNSKTEDFKKKLREQRETLDPGKIEEHLRTIESLQT